MSAPDLIVQTPGVPVANQAPVASAADGSASQQPPAAPAPAAVPYAAKHNGGGRWIVITNDDKATRIGDFVGDRDSIVPEVERMNAGGEPFVAPAPTVTSQAQAPQALQRQQPGEAIDPTTIKQAVMTSEGWLCPEPKAAKE
ncbi:hypothetical protein SAMN05216178_2037 [Pseudomonas saponiphila]|uniref:Uncharacterized protein n=1 Tax=Pseudomonas saponiphila TaxID=556534 RepID=A0A1H4LQK1_9PSED|nr:hypothetical protein [Pseudomonas saponiphila]SEB73059.1 hypothetical protein SAMN05216178_2037 [Pseudomonas saponiphila]